MNPPLSNFVYEHSQVPASAALLYSPRDTWLQEEQKLVYEPLLLVVVGLIEKGIFSPEMVISGRRSFEYQDQIIAKECKTISPSQDSSHCYGLALDLLIPGYTLGGSEDFIQLIVSICKRLGFEGWQIVASMYRGSLHLDFGPLFVLNNPPEAYPTTLHPDRIAQFKKQSCTIL